jgi:alkanesulfonate monooxygenase SsuD/methylene tetrahydromethanopterin reductase-like flavin-dependent oxidoreductase (luciferase family)
MHIETLQKPHPPIWYGAHSPDSAARAAQRGLNVINNDAPPRTRACLMRFREVWREAHGAAPFPKMGMVRFIVVAEDDAAALATARRAYPRWLESFNWLFRLHGRGPMTGERPADFDALAVDGRGIAGWPETVTARLSAQIADAGANYLVGHFVFGDMSPAEAERSIALFTREVMPALRESAKVAA